MLSPLLRCGRHIDEALRDESGRKLSKAARRAEAVRRLAEVGIHDPTVADRYPFELSGGMRQRVGIAAALARDPRILIADEPSTALDVTTQKEILALLRSLQQSRAMGLILITHDLRVAFSMCDRITVLYAGSVLEVAPAQALEHEPRHPYTLGLLLSEPPGDRRLSSLVAIPGSVADPDEVADVCAFSPRCVWAEPQCRAGKPPLRSLGDGRLTACIRTDELREQMRETRATANRSEHVALPSKGREALVSVEDLTKVFESGRGERARSVTALGGVSVELGRGRERRAGGRVGLGQDDAGALPDRTRDAHERADRGRRHRRDRLRGTLGPRPRPAPAERPDDLPGSLLHAESRAHGRRARSRKRSRCGPRGSGDLDARLSALLEQVGLPAAYAPASRSRSRAASDSASRSHGRSRWSPR